MRRVASVVLLGALAASGCTSVRMVQRDGCWVRQTERKPFGGVQEEVGPCVTPDTPWVEGDRLTRLVQECATRADHRWQSRALAAWSRGDALPEKAGRDDVLQECMNDAARAVVGDGEALKQENEALRRQLAALGVERDALRARDDRDRTELLATSSKLADHLGEAAKKAQQPAIATATARSEQSSDTAQAPPQPATVAVVQAPAVTPVFVPPAPAVAPLASTCGPDALPARIAPRQARAPAGSRRASAPAQRPNCDLPSPIIGQPGEPAAPVVTPIPAASP